MTSIKLSGSLIWSKYLENSCLKSFIFPPKYGHLHMSPILNFLHFSCLIGKLSPFPVYRSLSPSVCKSVIWNIWTTSEPVKHLEHNVPCKYSCQWSAQRRLSKSSEIIINLHWHSLDLEPPQLTFSQNKGLVFQGEPLGNFVVLTTTVVKSSILFLRAVTALNFCWPHPSLSWTN